MTCMRLQWQLPGCMHTTSVFSLPGIESSPTALGELLGPRIPEACQNARLAAWHCVNHALQLLSDLTAGRLQGMQPGMQPPQILQPDYAAYQAPYRQGGAVGHPHALPDGQYAQQYKGHEVQHAGGQGSLGGAASPYASMSYLERLQVLVLPADTCGRPYHDAVHLPTGQDMLHNAGESRAGAVCRCVMVSRVHLAGCMGMPARCTPPSVPTWSI